MNRNQKIALGCGGAGCLGLIVLAVACVIGYTIYQRRATYGNDDYNVNANRSANSNSSDSSAEEALVSDDASPSEDTSSSSMADDDKHKLFQAATMTQDSELVQRVWRKLGFMRASGSMTPEYEQFARDHFAWTIKNLEFIQSINTPEKARAYVDAHIND